MHVGAATQVGAAKADEAATATATAAATAAGVRVLSVRVLAEFAFAALAGLASVGIPCKLLLAFIACIAVISGVLAELASAAFFVFTSGCRVVKLAALFWA